MSQVKVFRDGVDDHSVWLDCDQENFTGLCLATGTRADVVIQAAIVDLLQQVEALRVELIRSMQVPDVR